MPDLTDDLRALLAERAADLPLAAPPPEPVVRRVRRRRALTVTAAATASAAAVVAVVGVAAAAVNAERRAVRPTGPGPSASPSPDESTPGETPPPGTCPTRADTTLNVEMARTGMAFARDCYTIEFGTTDVQFFNPQTIPHNLAVGPVGAPIYHTGIIGGGYSDAESSILDRMRRPLPRGEHVLFCQVHPLIRAKLVVR